MGDLGGVEAGEGWPVPGQCSSRGQAETRMEQIMTHVFVGHLTNPSTGSYAWQVWLVSPCRDPRNTPSPEPASAPIHPTYNLGSDLIKAAGFAPDKAKVRRWKLPDLAPQPLQQWLGRPISSTRGWDSRAQNEQ